MSVPNAAQVHARLLGRGILAGLPLARLEPDDPSLADALLVCATEVTRPDEISLLGRALREEMDRERQLSLEGLAGAESAGSSGIEPHSPPFRPGGEAVR